MPAQEKTRPEIENDDNVRFEELEYGIFSEAVIFCQDNDKTIKKELISLAIKALGNEWYKALQDVIKSHKLSASTGKKPRFAQIGKEKDILNALEKHICEVLHQEDYEDEEEINDYAFMILLGFCFPFMFAANIFDVLSNLDKESVNLIIEKRLDKRAQDILKKVLGDCMSMKGFPLKMRKYAYDRNIQEMAKKMMVELWEQYSAKNILLAPRIKPEQSGKLLDEIEENIDELLKDFMPLILSISPPADVSFENYSYSFAKVIRVLLDYMQNNEKHCMSKHILSIAKILPTGQKGKVNQIQKELENLVEKGKWPGDIYDLTKILGGEIDEKMIESGIASYDDDNYDVFEKVINSLLGNNQDREFEKVKEKIIDWLLNHYSAILLPLKSRNVVISENDKDEDSSKEEKETTMKKIVSSRRLYNVEEEYIDLDKDEEEAIEQKEDKKEKFKTSKTLKEVNFGFIACGIDPSYINKDGSYMIKKLLFLDFTTCNQQGDVLESVAGILSALKEKFGEDDVRVLYGYSNTARSLKQAGIISLSSKYILVEIED